jgi:alpha-beta hydrolase superfamily lysophospholipase
VNPIVTTAHATDGYRYYVRQYRPEGVPRGRVVFLHGIRSHGGWYSRSCAQFASAGYEVHFLDRRGSGWNTVRRGDCPGFRRLIDDVAEYVYDLRTRQAFLPTFLAGISWGGKLALGVPIRKPGLVDGVALVCPGLAPQIRPPFVQRIRVLLARLFRPEKLFPIPLNDPELFTDSAEWQRYVREDRYGLTHATARFLLESVRFDVYLKWLASRVTIPVLLMLAGRDKILDGARSRLYPTRWSHSKAITVMDYPEAAHTLEFEAPDHPFALDFMKWMERTAGIRSSR